MFRLAANKVELAVLEREIVTSGSVNLYTVQFTFSGDWDGLEKTAVFRAGDEKKSVLLDETNQCSIPWEVLQNPRCALEAGVYGTKGGTLVLPTVWAALGMIVQGAAPGEAAQAPTPDVYDQLLKAASQAQALAQSVREDADAGKFDGAQGPQGPQGPAGAGIPAITSDDEGKVLGVVNGAVAQWTQRDFFLVPIINELNGNYSTTVTMAQCLAKKKNGQILVAVVDGMMVPGSGYGGSLNDPEYLEFSAFAWPIAQAGYRIYRDNSTSLAITYVEASQIPITASGVTASTVQAAIEELAEKISNLQGETT